MGSRGWTACLVLAVLGLVGFVAGIANAPEPPEDHVIEAEAEGEASATLGDTSLVAYDVMVVFKPNVTDDEIGMFMQATTAGGVARQRYADYDERRAYIQWAPGVDDARRETYLARLRSEPVVERVEPLR